MAVRDNLHDRWVLACSRAGGHPERVPAILRDLLALDVLLALQKSPLGARLVLVGGGALRYCFKSPRIPYGLELRSRHALDPREQATFNSILDQAARTAGGEHVSLATAGRAWSSDVRITTSDGEQIALRITCDGSGGAAGEPRPIVGPSGVIGLIATPSPSELLAQTLTKLSRGLSPERVWDAYYLSTQVLAGGVDKRAVKGAGFDASELSPRVTSLTAPEMRPRLREALQDVVVPPATDVLWSLDDSMAGAIADDVADLIRRLSRSESTEHVDDRVARLAAWRQRHKQADE